jgi:ParB family chromosome partitioning protein
MSSSSHQVDQQSALSVWNQAREQIAQIEDPQELLRFVRSVETQARGFFALKSYAFQRARQLATNGDAKPSNGTISKYARGLGYRGRQFPQYAELGNLLAESSPDMLDVLDDERYWLDALRRKPSKGYLSFAEAQVKRARAVGKTMRPATVRALWDSEHAQFSPIIKPTDNWNFARVVYPPTMDAIGYIPGEIYANCLWYFAQSGHVVVDAMAGSGMIERVYEDRKRWLGAEQLEINVLMFDLHPTQPAIDEHNLLDSFPVAHADYIFLDPPYWGRCHRAYSDDPRDLANMSQEEFVVALNAIARNCASAQSEGGLCTVLMGNYTDVTTGMVILFIEAVRDAWRLAGYDLHHVAYASRHSQKTQSPGMANLNNSARRSRTPLTDMIEVLTFRRCASSLVASNVGGCHQGPAHS